MITSRYELFGTVMQGLIDTYAPGRPLRQVEYYPKGFAEELIKHTAVTIVSEIAFAHIREPDRRKYSIETLDRSIINIIWNNFPGGTTATSAAKKICEDLNIPWRDA